MQRGDNDLATPGIGGRERTEATRDAGSPAVRASFSLVTGASTGKIAFNNPGIIVMNLDGTDRIPLGGSLTDRAREATMS